MTRGRAKSKVVGPCRLCGEIAELQDSHVVPEFVHSPIYDEKHRAIAFDPLRPAESWRIQQGLKEPMLCQQCERFLNDNYERWFKEFWFDARPLKVLEASNQAILSIPDPVRFKLFHLSVLLRADLAGHGQWLEVDLGERHRQRLKEMGRRGDPGEAHEYPVVCMAIRRSQEDPSIWWDLIAAPNPGRMDGMRFYQFTFGGCGWLYYVSSHRLPLVESVALRPDGSLPVVKRDWVAFKRYAPHARLE